MDWNDLFHVELHNDKLKMFNQSWEETFLASGNDLDEHFLENCFQRHVVKSTLT